MKPLVSVLLITYNHAPYIGRCIEGTLMQKTTFPFEIVIGEDCSLDGTREIVMEYAQKNPETIRVITSESNVGMIENLKRTYLACQGKYIASCEGDDYWTDPFKLQKQVDFLEMHSEFVLCFHNTMIEYEDEHGNNLGHKIKYEEPWDTYSIDEIIVNFNEFTNKRNVTAGHTSSMVFRKGLLNDIPSWFSQSMSGDIFGQILLSQYGKSKFINEVMSVNRKHPGGITSSPNLGSIKKIENRLWMYENLRSTLGKKHEKAVDQVLAKYYTYLADYYCHQFRLKKAFLLYRRGFGRAIAVERMIRYVMQLLVRPFFFLSRQGQRIIQRVRKFRLDN